MTAIWGVMHLLAVCIVAQCLLPGVVAARETILPDSPTWCARHVPAAQPQCLRLEGDCRAALPDMRSAGGCPSRELEACVARQSNGGSWCALLCCFDPDAPACRAAANALPQVFSQPER